MNKEEIIRDLEEVVIDINLILNHEFSTELNMKLSHNQQMVLFLVGTRGVKHVKDLAYLLNISTSAVSQIVAKLEKKEMIERQVDPNNRRSTILKLGQAGKDLLNRLDKMRNTIFQKYLAEMDIKDLQSLRESFTKFREIIIEKKNEGDKS
ncbi:MarR family winged helix-turn-helix transcriptional regulator [Evansella clarkii]|uniref:MarR family winged helix-turn-helix transcriptional regulator n=1 Tax=Evansella clarkii TaxID=79879 RepID=UPI0014305342|nr:MarR family transcriptional regulator [Evansella clarkii]